MKESIPGLQILAFVGLLAVVLFGALFYFAEAGHWRPPGRHGYRMWDDDESSWTNYTDGVFTRSDYTGTSAEVSPFLSISRCMWYVAVTGPTTGYGDLYPTMSMGKSLGTFLCLCTMLVLAFPVTIIAKNMSERYSAITNPITPESPYKLQ